MLSFQLHPSISSFPAKFSNTQNQIRLKKPPDSPLLQTVHLSEDVSLDSVSVVRILSSCRADRNLKLGSCIHANVLKYGLDSNVFVGNALLDMYIKCGNLEGASKLFDRMPERTIVTWTSMMSGKCQNGESDGALSIFEQMLWESVHPNEYTLAVLLQGCKHKNDSKLVQVIHGYIIVNGFITDQFLQNSLIDAYSKSGLLMAAEELMEGLSYRDVVSWTSIISGFIANGLIEKALIMFFGMLEDGVMPNTVTIASVIHACSLMNKEKFFGWIHGFIIKAELCTDAHVMNSLVEMYSSNGCFLEGIRIFCEFCFTVEGGYLNLETMATLLQGCGHSGCLRLGEGIHGYLIKHEFFPCTMVENSLIDMYVENKHDDSAFQLFTKMSKRDIVSWNTMISCLVKNGWPSKALELLSEIHSRGDDQAIPDFITMLSSVLACSNLASLQLGQIIHGYITRSGLGCDVFVANSLIDMYSNSGKMDFAKRVFEDMPVKDMGSWNSVIAAYGINGNGTSALQAFAELKDSGVQPNVITFVNVLSACGHSGLVEEGFELFNSMGSKYGIEPSMEHFACMVDLLGRSGRVEEAEDFIKNMPLRPSPAVWGALLGACGLLGNVEVAERAAEKLSVLEPESKVWRVVLSNVYAGVGKWEDAAKVRAEMKGSEGMRKEAGWTSVEVRGESFRFMVGDTRHPESTKIYEVLNGITKHITDLAWTDQRPVYGIQRGSAELDLNGVKEVSLDHMVSVQVDDYVRESQGKCQNGCVIRFVKGNNLGQLVSLQQSSEICEADEKERVGNCTLACSVRKQSALRITRYGFER
ncbi:hypothetical protein HHK36_029020 [Tetracentron sinense]|uniref:Pentatricopeptide repeat-containing protein n=1 Tax=Tetracentron sinense TaxID=13715 RepID=A0A834YE63_TETSI|nr:hypothetical protein HHK36_029020 [Tetracentron sinense]